MSLIREQHPELGIGVAGYPEKHQEAPDLETDLLRLKQKVDAGANAVFTQLFFVNDNFLKFRDACGRLGIDVPIVPGIMPITEYADSANHQNVRRGVSQGTCREVGSGAG